jgi:fructose/tagatose bisphosphate aldolase
MSNIDERAYELMLTEDKDKKKNLAQTFLKEAHEHGIYPWSINDFYLARGKKKIHGFTVPAINLRTMTYDLARAVFRVARNLNAGAFILEIAKSEMGYTDQIPAEYASMCLAAAVREHYSGPVFIQGDHFQVNAEKYRINPEKEIQTLKNLITEAIVCGFYNIDIDSSTLVDLSQSTIKEQQFHNYMVCAELTKFIRKMQPKDLDISIGGEIGEVGGKNSTPQELKAFMQGYHEEIGSIPGISKISIQTGTSHGGVVLPDGSVAKMKLDFNTLETLSKLARDEFGMAGAVQHGASTLPPEAFGKFPDVETAEVHLATQFQNIIYDSNRFPQKLRNSIYRWLEENKIEEKKKDQTHEQFIYKTRKKALGPFKKDILTIPEDTRKKIVEEVEKKFEFIFRQLRVKDTAHLISTYLDPRALPLLSKRKLNVS